MENNFPVSIQGGGEGQGKGKLLKKGEKPGTYFLRPKEFKTLL